MAGTFDLLSSNIVGLGDGLTSIEKDERDEKLLVWQKLDIQGFQPPARHGHSAVTIGYGSIVFGGLEAGSRVNTATYFDAANNSWSLLPCKGDIPSPRSFHAACAFNGIMVVHGGEGPATPTETKGLSRDGVEDPVSSSLDTAFRPGADKPKYRTSQPLDGICPGDNIQPSRFGSGAPQSTLTKAISSRDVPIKTMTSLDDMYALDCSTLTWVKLPLTLGPLPRRGHTLNTCHVYGKPSLLLLGGYSIETMVVSNSVLVCEMDSVQVHVRNYIKRRKLLNLSKRELIASENGDGEEAGRASKMYINLDDYPLNPVVWRSVQCKGAGPTGRYRHSSTVLSTDMDELLIVIGGVGKDPNTSLSDVHILNLGSLTWMELKTNNSVVPKSSLTVSNQGPFMGVFGHVAFPVMKYTPPPKEDEEQEEMKLSGSSSYEILVFGGSSNPLDSAASAYHHLYAFDLEEHEWRKVLMGPEFPACRAFHSSNFISNWSPFHTIPHNQVVSAKDDKPKVNSSPQSSAHKSANDSQVRNNSAGQNIAQMKRTNSTTAGLVRSESAFSFPRSNNNNEDDDSDDMYIDFSTLDQTQHMNRTTKGSIFVFGGMGLKAAVNDAWVLDLQWRSAGLDQYDDSVAIKVKEQLNAYQNADTVTSAADKLTHVPFSTSNLHHSSNLSKIMSTNNAKYLQATPAVPSTMKSSASEPAFHQSADWPMKSNKMKLLEHLQSSTYLRTSKDFPHHDEHDENVSNELVLKLRTERAVADIQVKESRNQLALALQNNADLTKEIDDTRANFEQKLEAKEQEIKRLKELLHESLEREKKLMSLNAEAYNLIKLHSIQNL